MQSSMRGGNAPYQLNWDQILHTDNGLQREDIYRQRIYGNNSGTAQFIEVEQRRKIKPQWLLVYLIFVIATYTYTFDRLSVSSEYEVYEAIRAPFLTTVFRSDPQPEYYDDVLSMDDVKDWLLNAFPDIVTPEIQHFNKPLGQIRFTMRKMKMQNNSDVRLNDFQPQIWNSADGINPTDTSDENDDKEPFGAYRVWANVSLDWSFPVLFDKDCPSDSIWIDTVDFSASSSNITIKNCRQWCEQLIHPLTCHCFSKSSHSDDGICNFYQVPSTSFTEASSQTTVLLALPDPDNSIVIPQVVNSPGNSAYFPKMKRFIWSAADEGNEKGYRKTPGFIQYLSYYNQNELITMAARDSITPSTPQRIMSSEIEDWLAGGYLGRQAVTLSVDFATYNINYDMFSWVQLTFTSSAAGLVLKDFSIESIKIVKSQDLVKKWSVGDEFSTFWSVIYIILFIFYCACEAWEMSCCSKGIKYFWSMWNWLTMLHLMLNLTMILLFLIFKGQTDFIDELIAMQSEANPVFQTRNLISFADQVSKYKAFKVSASLNMLVTAFQGLQYLNDIQPRVAVLVDTVSNSFMPIFFFTLVCCVFIYGTVMWTLVWFGRNVSDFKSFSDTFVTVIAMTVGEFSSFPTLRSNFGLESFLFYIPYQLFMIVLILNFPRAVLCAAYSDSVTSHRENQQQEKSRQAAKDSNTGSNDIYRCLKTVKVTLKRLLPDEFNAKELVKIIKNKRHVKVKRKQAQLALYLLFTILYTTMCIMIMKTANANSISEMINKVTREPSFEKINPISGQSIRGANFDSINSRADVANYLDDVLPKSLFSTSSAGNFNGQPNPLLQYNSAPQYSQLVINDWSIVFGQKPVRVTIKYNKMKEIGDDAIKGVLLTTDLVRETSSDEGVQATVSETNGLPDSSLFVDAKTLSEITDPNARAALQQLNCAYSYGFGASSYKAPDVENNGWVCMLSVDKATTVSMLHTIADKLVTKQAMALTLDYVIYNGWAETFAYVAVKFGFQPSGLVYKHVDVETINLQLHSGGHGVILIILEVLVMAFNVYYLIMLFFGLAKAMFPRKDKHQLFINDKVTITSDTDLGAIGTVQGTVQGFVDDKVIVLVNQKKRECGHHDLKKVEQSQEHKPIASYTRRFFGVLREFILFFALDWFNIFDFMSCVCTIVTLSLFWTFCSSPLAQAFFFQEEPVWVTGKCASNNFEWCSDQQVITEFFVAKGTFKNFVRICSLNTVFVFMRLLRYVKAFRSMQVIFNTMVRGFEDICWFVVVMFTGLLGYQFCGHIVFGGTAEGFKTKWSSLRACFEIFLGKFDGKAMAEVDLVMTIFYVLTFWFIFKLIVINMFLAIIDKNYKEEDIERQEKEIKARENPRKKQPSALSLVLRSVKNLFAKGGADAQDQQAGSGDGKTEEQAQVLPVTDSIDTAGIQPQVGISGDVGAGGVGETVQPVEEKKLLVHDESKMVEKGVESGGSSLKVSMDVIKKPNWKELPDEIKVWSLDKATAVCDILNDLVEKRRDVERDAEDEPDPARLDSVLEEAETTLLNYKTSWEEEAQKVKKQLDAEELAELKSVHKDQESLSWYIMKREAELKKLESAKELKQERFDKMAQAAKSLINSKDD